jgi:hypothetical protein
VTPSLPKEGSEVTQLKITIENKKYGARKFIHRPRVVHNKILKLIFTAKST